MLSIAEKVNDLIQDTEQNVTQYCKQELCWQVVRECSMPLDQAVLDELIDKDSVDEMESVAKRTQKIQNDINCQTYVYEKGAPYWRALEDWNAGAKVLSPMQMGIVGTATKMPAKIPSDKQSQLLIEIEKRAIEEGFYVEG